MDELVVLDHEPHAFLFALWKNVTILVWAARTNDGIPRLKLALAKVAGSHPKGRSTVSLIADGLAPPSNHDKERAAFLELVRQASDLVCFAVVVKGEGFAASAWRSVHTGMRLRPQQPCEIGVLGSIDELMHWLPSRHAKTGVILNPDELGLIVRHALEIALTGKT